MSLDHTRPNSALSEELTEVAVDARNLTEYLKDGNDIRTDFPAKQLDEIAHSLLHLKQGSSAGARDVLRYASKRLPAIRREFLHHESLAAEVSSDNDFLPQQTRGMTLDRRLKDLIASVNTALDECRKQEGENIEESEDIELRVSHAYSDPDTVTALIASRKVSYSSTEASDELRAVSVGGSARADALDRNLRDVSALGNIAATELSFRTTVFSWLAQIGTTLQKYPELIEALGKTLQKGVDITDATYLRWEALKHRLAHVMADEIRSAGSAIETLGTKWKSERDSTTRSKTTGAPRDSQPKPPGFEEFISNEVERRLLQETAASEIAPINSRMEAVRKLARQHGTHETFIPWFASLVTSEADSRIAGAGARELANTTLDDRKSAELAEALISAYDTTIQNTNLLFVIQLLGDYRLLQRNVAAIEPFFFRIIADHVGAKPTLEALKSLLSFSRDRARLSNLVLELLKQRKIPEIKRQILNRLTEDYLEEDLTKKALIYTITGVNDVELKLIALNLIQTRYANPHWAREALLGITSKVSNRRLKDAANKILRQSKRSP
jgi:hypothetical protein